MATHAVPPPVGQADAAGASCTGSDGCAAAVPGQRRSRRASGLAQPQSVPHCPAAAAAPPPPCSNTRTSSTARRTSARESEDHRVGVEVAQPLEPPLVGTTWCRRLDDASDTASFSSKGTNTNSTCTVARFRDKPAIPVANFSDGSAIDTSRKFQRRISDRYKSQISAGAGVDVYAYDTDSWCAADRPPTRR